MRITRLLAAGVVAAMFSVPAGAVVSFANYAQTGTGTSIAYSATAGVGTVGAVDENGVSPVRVNFNFADPLLTGAGATNLTADFRMNLTATRSPLSATPGFVVQQGLTGGFSFTYAGTTPLFVNGRAYATGANLLTGTFTDATIFGQAGATTGALSGTAGQSGLVFTSDFLTFAGPGGNDATFGLNAINPGLFAGSTALTSFLAASVGTFGAAVAPAVSAVPEPASWAAMALGFGLVGRGLRRRHRVMTTHA